MFLVGRVCLFPVNTASCPVCGSWRTRARRPAPGPDDMRVGSAAHVHVEGFTCVSRGLRAYRGVNAHTQGLTCERTMWLSGRYHPGQAPDNAREQSIPPETAQHADHFVTSSPLSAFFTELVCTFGAAAFRQAPRRGELRHPRLRHADAALRMAQKPHCYQCRGVAGVGGPGNTGP